MNYIWGARVWHTQSVESKVGAHPFLETKAHHTDCGAMIPLGCPVKTGSPPPGVICKNCALPADKRAAIVKLNSSLVAKMQNKLEKIKAKQA